MVNVQTGSNTANITAGSVTGITDITVADGGTGSSTAAAARSALFAINYQGSYATNMFYNTQLQSGTSVSSLSSALDVYYSIPIYVGITTTFTRIGCRLTVGAGTIKFRIGLYNNASAHPTTLVFDAGETTIIGPSGAADREVTISQAVNPGWYWLVIVTDTSLTTTFDAASCQSLGNFGLNASNDVATNFNLAVTYGALSADITATAMTRGTAATPLMWLRVV